MRVKTITCHDVYNYGASLQAYALQYYLEGCGHDVEIIDYKPCYLSHHFDIWRISNPFWEKNFLLRFIYLALKLPGRIMSLKRKCEFDDFTKRYLKRTIIRYKSNDELKKNCPVGDLFIAGSDQIWNCQFQNGKDPAFFLDFVPENIIKASYAASFASSFLEEKYKNLIRNRVSRLNYVSVREFSGLEILRGLGINNGFQVLDPVFLLEKNVWKKMVKEVYKGDYLFVYDFEGSEQIKQICLRISKERNLKIYSVNCTRGYVDKKFLFTGPEKFLSLIYHCKYVVSNSFHGTAFALIFEKEFVVVERSEQINARMIDLLKCLGIPERLIADYETLEPLKYSVVNKKLEKQKELSKSYIRTVLLNK